MNDDKGAEQLRSNLLKAIGSYLEQNYPDNPIHYDDFTDHVFDRIKDTRADSGEAVAWLQVEPGVSLEQAVSENGILAHSMQVHVGRQTPNKSQDANGLFPLFTHARATAVDVRDKVRLDWLDSEACTVRAVETDNGRDMHFEVVSYHMAVPSERIDGIGSTPRAAIDAAIASREGR